ncbi:DNA/RNA helicase, superfamily II, SNF2 family protein [Phormidesmis priestleyi ULC007]|uniref:DNA/RNA helicase, superfamily II, SNF2 family protein n=1 Tax=Phormidesmis priestleyi ULC007 TaxID=1920490 RepID=A0A2T1D8E7_9CYAN|nr:SNF2-related protein [Phormidesmis priestleyi]PSB16778.1 DNA/RNA helicase, superfamily II, SNF2 family protein [Phormidesmis priestleyi ULC007]PZO47665.1 MAG: DNA/RNA helicase, superfamily II, SNF2 family protein [Phormidesmis priestleyi]
MSDTSWNPAISGQEVRVKANPGHRGITTGKTRASGTRLLVQVQFSPNEKSYKPYNLLELCGEPEGLLDLLEQGKFSGADDLRRILTFEKVKGQLTNIFYSMESSHTDFYPHQFKPVLKFLESPVGRLLVADEVGLGKTIEAIYIWKELQARADARRLLIICPAILREKWRDDLQQRFNIIAKLTNAQALLEEVKYVLQSQYQHPFVCIASLEGLRPSANWEDATTSGAKAELARLLDNNNNNPAADESSVFDLVIIDEAHYLRNQATANHRLGQLVRDAARHLLLLTATPIQTQNNNLYQLLKIISPEDFFDETIFHQMLEANAPLIRALRSLWSHPPDFKAAKRDLDRALQSDYFQHNSVLRQIQHTLETPDAIDAETQVRLGYKLESASLVSQYLTRSRKRDVLPNRVERAPQTLKVHFSALEKEIYESVTQAIRKQSKGKQGVLLFRLIARQRQMASCLVAALKTWSEQGILDEFQDELFWESGISTTQSETETLPDRETLPLENINYAQLEFEDTKYQALVRFLHRELKKHPDEQFALFAYFRGTLHYLQHRLETDGIQTSLILGGMGDQKQEVLSQFKQGNTSILLSSEVGSEGIDLQFCRFLINYDLPWNPMRVEQRIGRIDRLGQKADRISIINFSLVDTIEERILDRLYQRINVFQESIGDLENILGEATEKLLVTLFESELTDAERLKRADETASAILKQRLQQDQLEQESVNLMAFSDQILDAVSKSRNQGRWLTSEELHSFVEDYFARYYLGTTLKPIQGKEAVFEIKLTEDAKVGLELFLKHHRFATQTRLHRSPAFCLFDPRLAEQPGKGTGQPIELLDPTHPLIQWIRHSYDNDAQKLHPISAVRCEQSDVEVAPGKYVYVIHRWLFQGLRSESRLAYKVAQYSDGKLLSDEQSERLLYRAARWGKAKLNAANLLENLDQVLALYCDCDDALEAGFDQASAEFAAENDNRCDVQQRSAESYADRRRQQLEDRIQTFQQSGKLRMLPATEGQLRKVNQELEIKKKLIGDRRNTELNVIQLAAGIIFVEP